MKHLSQALHRQSLLCHLLITNIVIAYQHLPTQQFNKLDQFCCSSNSLP